MAAEISLWPYVKKFALVYTPIMLIGFAIVTLFEINVNSGLSLGFLMASSVLPSQHFVRDHQRAMTRGERARYALWAMLLSLLISAVVFAAASFYLIGKDQIGEAITLAKSFVTDNPVVLAISVVFACLFSWFAIYLGAGIFGKQALKSLK